MCAAKLLKPSSALRREPSQERAQQTIATIFQATAQIVDSEGEAALSTNKIAAKAGFSIGTLYQYFPTKEAILLAMVRRERERVMQEAAEFLEDVDTHAQDLRAALQSYIHKLIHSFAAGHPGRKLLCRIGWRADHHDDIASSMREMTERISVALSRISALPGAPKLRSTPAVLFVVTRSVMGAIRSASLEKSALLDAPEFEAELVRLAWAMLVDDTQ
jgi:AcrR family transcriptional regulator